MCPKMSSKLAKTKKDFLVFLVLLILCSSDSVITSTYDHFHCINAQMYKKNAGSKSSLAEVSSVPMYHKTRSDIMLFHFNEDIDGQHAF